MKDYFGRVLKKGDTIVYKTKFFRKGKVVGFGSQFGKPYAEIGVKGGKRVQGEFIIFERGNGEKFEWISPE